MCGAEKVSLVVPVELLGFTSSGGLVSIMLYGGGGVSAGKKHVTNHRFMRAHTHSRDLTLSR